MKVKVEGMRGKRRRKWKRVRTDGLEEEEDHQKIILHVSFVCMGICFFKKKDNYLAFAVPHN